MSFLVKSVIRSTLSNKNKTLFGSGNDYVNTYRVDEVSFDIGSTASYFGDLSRVSYYGGAAGNLTTALFAAGGHSTSYTDTKSICFMLFETQSNAFTFGDLTASKFGLCGISSMHGGL